MWVQSKRVAVLGVLAVLCTAYQTPAGAGPPARPAYGAEGGLCGGRVGFRCEAGLYCRMRSGECRSVADASGTCRKPPQLCSMIYAPVCGCDDKTYSNACVAGSKGVSVAARGVCKG